MFFGPIVSAGGGSGGGGSGSGICARVQRSTNQNIPDSTATPISFDTILINNGACFDISFPTRLTAPVTGVYLVGGTITWAAAALTAARLSTLLKNGNASPEFGIDTASGTGAVDNNKLSELLPMNAGDYFEMVAYQNSGGALNVLTDDNNSAIFWMVLV